MHYLYKITCLINGKIYIGQTKNLEKRWKQHTNESKKDKPEMILHKAMKKYGVNNFNFEVIATCKTLDDSNETEILLIKQYNSLINNKKGYNVEIGGNNSPINNSTKKKISKATKKQMSILKASGLPIPGAFKKGNKPSNKKALDEDKIKNEYLSENYSIKSLAKEYKVSGPTIKKIIKDLPLSSKSISKKDLDEENIRDQYLSGNYSTRSLAKEYKVDRNVIKRIIKGLPLSPKSICKKDLNEPEIRAKYLSGETVRGLSRAYKVDRDVIKRIVKDILRPSKSQKST